MALATPSLNRGSAMENPKTMMQSRGVPSSHSARIPPRME